MKTAVLASLVMGLLAGVVFLGVQAVVLGNMVTELEEQINHPGGARFFDRMDGRVVSVDDSGYPTIVSVEYSSYPDGGFLAERVQRDLKFHGVGNVWEGDKVVIFACDQSANKPTHAANPILFFETGQLCPDSGEA